jgi:hypothetical protein
LLRHVDRLLARCTSVGGELSRIYWSADGVAATFAAALDGESGDDDQGDDDGPDAAAVVAC